MCDFIDLEGGDYTALYGWTTAIVIGALLGTTIGFVKATAASRFATPTLTLWLLIFSLCMLNPSILLLLKEDTNPFLVNWCKTMIACGVVYAALGIAMWVREYRESKLERLRLSKVLEATCPRSIHQFPQD